MKKLIFAALCVCVVLTSCAKPVSPPASSESALAPAPASSQPTSSAAEGIPDSSSSSEPAPVVVFPTIDGTDLDGNPLPEDIFLKDGVTMINVWATFCNPCIREMPDLGELSREYLEAGTPLKIIGICSDTILPQTGETIEKNITLAKEIVEQTKADYLHIIPGDSLWKDLLPRISAVPTTFFVNDKGEIIDGVAGAGTKADWTKMVEIILETQK